LIETAESKGLFLMEAAWTRFFPHTKEIKRLLHEEKVLGPIHRVFADFSLVDSNPSSRLHDPHLGGGALLDLGFYPLTWAFLTLYDDPDNEKTAPTVTASVLKTARGVDEYTSVALTFEKLHAVAFVSCSLSARTVSPYGVFIQGEKVWSFTQPPVPFQLNI
jgi:dihydrodiol dehydrogenase / D-xylose 1-dehydrogenase (NADP)